MRFTYRSRIADPDPTDPANADSSNRADTTPSNPAWLSPLSPRRSTGRSTVWWGQDPYASPTAAAVTRRQLTSLLAAEDRELTLITASPRVLADLGLLRELDRQHVISITLALAATDLELARRLDPLAPDPRAVLSAGARLSAEGLTTRFLCRPLVVGVNTLERTLRPLFEAARNLGAVDVLADLAAEPEALPSFDRLRLAYGFPQRVPGRG